MWGFGGGYLATVQAFWANSMPGHRLCIRPNSAPDASQIINSTILDSWRPGATFLWNLATTGVEEGLVTNDGKKMAATGERDAEILTQEPRM